MLILRGKLRAVLDVPASTNKKTAEVYAAYTSLQIETTAVSRGVEKIELHNITVSDAKPFRDQVGKDVNVPVRAYAPGARVTLVQQD